ncbi:MAG: protoporphyrinogen oxidase [Acidobacteriales bacterium]|nr:protoporphyrinogen oxidase [Terriglobales bacterium]
MKRVAIIGGGISGLSAAFHFEKARQTGVDISYTLFESEPRLGGVLRTEKQDGLLLEAGPDSFLSAKPWAADLAREVGLANELIHSNDFQRKTYILNRGHLTPLPDGIQMIVPTKAWPVATSPLLSFGTKIGMLREYFSPPAPLPPDQDESVASFVARHFGEEVVNKLASPLLAGVYGGDAAQLSARAVLPHFVALEAKHRSLVRGVLGAKKTSTTNVPLFTSFKGGMQQFVDAIAARLTPASIALTCKVSALDRQEDQWRIVAACSATELFTDILLALPSQSAASLLQEHNQELARTLASIDYSNSITIALGYDASKLNLPPGFGFLVPRTENRSLIACTFVHNKFDHRVPAGRILLRVFLTEGLDKSDAELQSIVERELSEIMSIKTPADFVRISRWSRAMPQYHIGHLQKLASIEKMSAAIPHLQLIGNAYRGIGIPDCVREGKLAAEKLLKN